MTNAKLGNNHQSLLRHLSQSPVVHVHVHVRVCISDDEKRNNNKKQQQKVTNTNYGNEDVVEGDSVEDVEFVVLDDLGDDEEVREDDEEAVEGRLEELRADAEEARAALAHEAAPGRDERVGGPREALLEAQDRVEAADVVPERLRARGLGLTRSRLDGGARGGPGGQRARVGRKERGVVRGALKRQREERAERAAAAVGRALAARDEGAEAGVLRLGVAQRRDERGELRRVRRDARECARERAKDVRDGRVRARAAVPRLEHADARRRDARERLERRKQRRRRPRRQQRARRARRQRHQRPRKLPQRHVQRRHVLSLRR